MKLLLTAWDHNITPQGILKGLPGVWGRSFVTRVVRRRFPDMSEQDVDLVAEYLYGISTGPVSGGYALNALMQPVIQSHAKSSHPSGRVLAGGLFARSPIAPRLSDALAQSGSDVHVSVLFGDRDWMFQKEVLDTRLVLSRRASVHVVESAGHHLYMDNAHGFHEVFERELRKSL
jgi:hypothetical protein